MAAIVGLSWADYLSATKYHQNYSQAYQQTDPHDFDLLQSLTATLVAVTKAVLIWIGNLTTDNWIAAGTLVIAIFTVVLSIATIKLYQAGERQLRIAENNTKASLTAAKSAKRSADVAQETQIVSDRAWISIRAEIIGPLIFGPDEISVHVEYTFENIGRGPATGVRWESKLHANAVDAGLYAKDSARRADRLWTMQIDYGRALFPGNSFPDDRVEKLSTAEFKESIARIAKDFAEDAGRGADDPYTHQRPALTVSAWYVLPGDNKSRVTILPFEIGMRNDDDHSGWDGNECEVPEDSLALSPTFLSGQIR